MIDPAGNPNPALIVLCQPRRACADDDNRLVFFQLRQRISSLLVWGLQVCTAELTGPPGDLAIL